MLESTSARLLRPYGPHWKAPDKVPSLRIRTIEAAGELRIAFTTGMLIGIGETFEERIDTLLAIRQIHERYGHIQEVIVQPFRAKPGTRMAAAAEPSLEDLQRALAVARIILGGEMNLQSPPNLTSDDYPLLLDAGINDWGGISPVTADFINPEAAWPQIAACFPNGSSSGWICLARTAGHLSRICRATGVCESRSAACARSAPGGGQVCMSGWCPMLKAFPSDWQSVGWQDALTAASRPVSEILIGRRERKSTPRADCCSPPRTEPICWR